MGVILLVEILDELKAIRAELQRPEAPVVSDVPSVDPASILKGRIAKVKEAISACDDVSVLAGCLSIETAKARPRSTVLAAIRSRIETLN